MEEARFFWVGFNLVRGIGPMRLRLLLQTFGDARTAWLASRDELVQAGLGPRLADALVETRLSGRLEGAWETIRRLGITVLTWDDLEYPRRLKELDQPPPVLYVRGRLTSEDLSAVAVVGTRRVTSYGRQVAADLARNGVTVVSGLAAGCDTLAHQSALQAGGRTLAVMATGVDLVYPPQNRALAEKILGAGALISDYPPGTPPEAGNFPPRNRLISGLSQVVVVVEASEQSGALITAAFGAEQGRPVFAVPGPLYASQSKGTNRLIREGARILTDLQDILELLNLAQLSQQRQARAVLPEDATEANLYALLSHDPQHIDDLRRQSDLPIELVASTLTLMELKGLARQVGGMRYVAVYEPSVPYETARQDYLGWVDDDHPLQ